jgi:hypothetical protein
MVGTKLAERISFFMFLAVLLINIIAVLIILFSGSSLFREDLLSKAAVALPLSWLLAIVSLSNAFNYVNETNQKIFDVLVRSPLYYLLIILTLSLFSIYTFYVHLLCNQKRTVMWSGKFYFLYKLFALFPFINLAVMYMIIGKKEDVVKILRLYLSFSLARFIYMNYKTNIDVFS